MRALGRIAPGTKSAEAAIAALIEALDPDWGRGANDSALFTARLHVIDALQVFGASASGALPRLRALHADRNLSWAADRAVTVIEGAGSGEQDRNQDR